MQNFISNLVAPPAQTGGPADDVPWWMRYAGKGTGIGGGIAAIFFGLWAAISFSPFCIIAGIWQILAGFLLLLIEAPFCFAFIPQAQMATAFIEQRSLWQKALLILALSAPPFFLCMALGTFIGSGLIFTTAVIYAVMALGKKAPRDQMMANAGGQQQTTGGDKSDLVGNIQGQDVEAARGTK